MTIALNGSPAGVRAMVLGLLGLAETPTISTQRGFAPQGGKPAWVPLTVAAEHLSIPIHGLRRQVENASNDARVRGEDPHDSGTWLQVHGLTVRRFGHQWRVWLGTWGQP